MHYRNIQKKCVYGLNDAARSSYDALFSVLSELNMTRSKLDKALFLYHENERLSGFFCVHVDDVLYAGSSHFLQHVVSAFKRKFVVGKEQSGNLKHLGLDITRNSNGTIAISQKEYIENLPRNSLLSDERAPKSVLGKLEWIAQQTRSVRL